ncbi:MAG: HoxN/HupN/NixA family nickel/cobalt transporter [Peptococcaceae bacterium]|jgi:high-affinity nickel-transport protein|nr:HoxN/HupN/NixA family nickel/cobalt transporter [Peptococcaceae bacterium]
MAGFAAPGIRDNNAKRIGAMYAVLILFNIAVFLVLARISAGYPYLLSVGLLAYVFGLRHACDADHIAAIDNTTRKLSNEGKKPLGIGLFFSLGHSTIVILLSIGLAVATTFVKANIPGLEAVGSIVGTLISAAFLYLIAALNIVIFADAYKVFKQVRMSRGDREKLREMEELLMKRGFMGRIFGGLFKLINSSWQMYPIGVLFGLGFDTASEVAVLAIAATAAVRGMPLIDILILPLMFMAGMTLVDTTDGIVMQYAYGWAFVNPVRKIYYNLSITGISVLVALVVGGIEWLQVLSQELGLKGLFWNLLQTISFARLGFVIIGLLVVSWLAAIVLYKLKDYEKDYYAA